MMLPLIKPFKSLKRYRRFTTKQTTGSSSCAFTALSVTNMSAESFGELTFVRFDR